MAYLNLSVPACDVARECQNDGEMFAEIINEVGMGCSDDAPSARWLGNLVENLDDDGMALIRHLAAAIEASDEGGGT